MQLILSNDIKFKVNSFTESLDIRREDNNSETIMNLTVNISYADSLEDLVLTLKDLDTTTLTIEDLEGNGSRTYANFGLNSANQNVNDFHRIETTLHFSKDYSE